MDNLFDGYKRLAFDTVASIAGNTAYFTPSTSGPTQTVKGFFNHPTTIEKLGKIEYSPTNHMFEFRAPFMPELKPSVDAGGTEYLFIDSQKYYVQSVKGGVLSFSETMYDGDAFIAILEKVSI